MSVRFGNTSGECESRDASASEEPKAGIWREGDALVFRPDAEFPDWCIKTNAPAFGQRRRVKLSWVGPGFYLITTLILVLAPTVRFADIPIFLGVHYFFASIPILLCVHYFMAKRVTLDLPISEAWIAQHRQFFVLKCGLLLIAITGIFYGSTIGMGWYQGALLVAFLVWWVAFRRLAMVRPTHVSARLVCLRGAHAEFLERFPSWTTNRRGVTQRQPE